MDDYLFDQLLTTGLPIERISDIVYILDVNGITSLENLT
jgi:hypothetical protein